jgi:hypothetical protein
VSLSGHDAPHSAPRDDDWEAAGFRLGQSLDTANLVLVLGRDSRETALAALGIARAQATRRRVALGDLFGDAEPIASLSKTDDPHGLVDSFLYGVSLNRIARAVPELGDLYVMPSGSDVSSYEEIFTNPRWGRLANGFRETGSLLLVAAPADAAHVEDVVKLGDGAVLLGGTQLPAVAADKLLGRVQPDNGTRVASEAEAPGDTPAASEAPPVRWWQRGPFRPASADGPSWRSQRPLPAPAIGGIVLAVALAAVGIWLAARPLARGHQPLWLRRGGMSTSAGAVPSTLDSNTARLDSIAGDSNAAALLRAANRNDSAAAAAYSVALMTTNTQAGAIWWFQTSGRSLPAATFSPILVKGAPWFRVLVGAYSNRAQADSLLATLREKGELRAGVGDVVRAPFAFLVDSVSAEAVPTLLKYFADRGQPVYALWQPDGSARLYAGAFENREQAAMFVNSVRAAGIRPALVYRLGRAH